jgi:hypothetical protein
MESHPFRIGVGGGGQITRKESSMLTRCEELVWMGDKRKRSLLVTFKPCELFQTDLPPGHPHALFLSLLTQALYTSVPLPLRTSFPCHLGVYLCCLLSHDVPGKPVSS